MNTDPTGEFRDPLTPPPALNRRAFLATGAAALLPGAARAGNDHHHGHDEEFAASVGPRSRLTRANLAYLIRTRAALAQRAIQSPPHPTNGDEQRYADRIASYTKGLPHDAFGHVDRAAFDALVNATRRGSPQDYDAIPLGGQRPLVNPQAGLAFDLEGADSHALAMPPAPAFASREQIGEIVENYWMALARDVPFSAYSTHPLTVTAAADLSRLTDFRGPKEGGIVTARTLFRDALPGAATGPYLSQFLLQPVPFGANFVEQRMRTTMPGVDFMTTPARWLSVQRGGQPTDLAQYDPTRRFIRNGRDLGQWVHIDVLFQAYFHAMLILLAAPDAQDPNSSGMGAPFDAGNPYASSRNQEGFGTFGGPHIATLTGEVATRALKAVWFQKWNVHRRLRPEAFAGRIHHHLTGAASYPLDAAELARSQAPAEIFVRHGSYLLPMAFPEGSPLHPSYGAGHATVAGACVTILKAWFDESYVIPNPVEPSPDGLSLVPYAGPPLTLGGELNKLASNVGTGRNIAGVHWRSDAIESFKLGEAVGISLLRDQRLTYNEDFDGFTLTKFDGTTVRV